MGKLKMSYYFVCGTKRSATHYLNRLLDGHPELGNTVTESYIFEYYLAQGAQLEEKIVNWLKYAPVRDVYEDIHRRQLLPTFSNTNYYDNATPEKSSYVLEFNFQSFLSAFEKARKKINSLHDLVLIWTNLLGMEPPWIDQIERKKWVFKCADFGPTILGAAQMNLLDKAVFLLRNPLGIVNSIKKRREKEKHRSFHFFELLQICKSLENVVPLLDTFKDKCLVISYENLVNDEKKYMETLCNFWGISWNEQLTKPTLLGEVWEINSSFSGIKKDILSDYEKKAICLNTKLYQKTFGYSL
ncbi:MAG: sulfotransferase [Desulfobulbaceae bacterium]|nr:sulfotransferase [Desulfobulbaceae bacterium]